MIKGTSKKHQEHGGKDMLTHTIMTRHLWIKKPKDWNAPDAGGILYKTTQDKWEKSCVGKKSSMDKALFQHSVSLCV